MKRACTIACVDAAATLSALVDRLVDVTEVTPGDEIRFESGGAEAAWHDGLEAVAHAMMSGAAAI